MNLSVIFNAIVPDNIKDIELVKKCSNIFIEQLNRNSTISRRISDLFDIDKKTWLQQDTYGGVREVSDSEMITKSKEILKQGLFQVYLNVLYNLVEKIQMDPNVKEATDIRKYENSLIYKNIYDILTSEYLGAFRYFQQNSGTKNAINYIYQFAKYLETGYLSSDLELDDTSGNFVLKYDGSLHKRYFSAFNQPMAHPCGWCYEYTTVISFILEDYFGIIIDYKMPRGVSIKTDDEKYIVFTDSSIEEFYNSLSEPMNVFSENALSDERIEEIKKLKIGICDISELKNFLVNYNIVIINKKFSKYQYFDDYKKIIQFEDNTCLFFDSNLYYGNIGDIYELDKMFVFPKTYHLNIGTHEQILATKTIKILYRDEVDFEIEFEGSYEKDAGYYKNSFEDKFHLTGNSYPFIPGIDESRNKVLNYEECKNNLNCYNAKIDVTSENLTYISASDDFGHHSIITDENIKNFTFNTHGWYNNNLNFVGLNAQELDYDYYLKTNVINRKTSSLYLTVFKTINNKIEISGYSETSVKWKMVVLGFSDVTGTIQKGNFKLSIDTFKYDFHSEYYLELSNSKDIIKIESNGINYTNEFQFGFPFYEGTPAIPRFEKCTPDTMLEIESGDRILSDISLCELPLIYTNSELENYENKGNIAEPKTYWDLNSETWNGLTYIDEGFKFIKTDNCDCYVPDSTEYVDDEFECFIMGYGYYLVFLNDHDEGSDSLGKFLVNRYNVKSKNLEGIRGMLRGLVLTCS